MEILKETIRSLRSNKMRTFLSMLGIIIGVMAVITVVAVGEGATNQIKSQISSLGSNMIFVQRGYYGGQGGAAVKIERNPFSLEDADKINEMAPSVKNAVSLLGSSFLVQGGKNNSYFTVYGASEIFFDLLSVDLISGRNVSYEDYKNAENNVVVGYNIASKLFPGENPIGKTIYMIQPVKNFTRKVAFEIIGLMEKSGSIGFFDVDNMILMNDKLSDARLFQSNGRTSIIVAQAKSEETAKLAIKEIDHYMYEKFGNDKTYEIMSQDAMLETVGQVTNIMKFVLISIAAISLLVGGIGIMNIMLVSVTERTKEIGIKMAIGATRKRILSEFLVESVLITFIAGIIGVLFGWGLSQIITIFGQGIGLVAEMTLEAIIVSFSVSAGVGLFFGIYPANKASKLSPIEALRYE
jgi:putative ABC transport system permease protein